MSRISTARSVSRTLPPDDSLCDVTALASLSVSSSAKGNPSTCLLDDNLNTFWQSDDLYTHLINLEFPERVSLMRLSLYIDFFKDENYTPQEISVHTGNTLCDLQEVARQALYKPAGWVNFYFSDNVYTLDDDSSHEMDFGAQVIQIAIISNHMSGKDSRIRQIKVYSRARFAFDPHNTGSELSSLSKKERFMLDPR